MSKDYYVKSLEGLTKIWLDDIRPAPGDDWIHVKVALDAINFLKTGLITEISLDHDLGWEDDATNHIDNGYVVACYLERAAYNKEIPRLIAHVHSANPVGVEKMEIAIAKAMEYWDRVIS